MRRSIFLLCIIGVACGGSVTSVDGNKSTATLSPTDQNQLCTDVYNYVKASFSPTDIARMSCGFSFSTSGTTDPTTCQSDFSACVQKETANTTNGLNQPLDCTTFDQQVASCNTTVATYTKCLTEEVNAMKSLESQMPFCSQSAAEAADLNAMSQLSSDCLALANSCPGLGFGGTTSSGGGATSDGGLPD